MSQNRRSRRDFLITTAAAGTLTLLSPEEILATLVGPNFVRMNVANLTHSSPDIVAYKAGITAMKALGAANPLSWNNFANIHGSPAGAGPLWNTCQHGHWWFLPWHRMYLLFFERTIRKLSNKPAFSLPFWGYTAGAGTVPENTYPIRSLPRIFRLPALASNALFVANPNRGPGINAGFALSAASTSSAAALGTANFTGPTGSASNFGSQMVASPTHFAGPAGRLESTPHNAVHSSLAGWMGDPNMAARDPIFWLHHANIDRLWNAWLANNPLHKDPSNLAWCNQIFRFFNENGVQVNMRVRDVINALAQLHIRYEGEPAIPAQTCPPGRAAEAPVAALNIAQRTLMTAEQPTTLGATPTTLTMRMPSAAVRERARGAITAANRTLVLRVEGIKADTQPGVIYEVYVGLPAGVKPDISRPEYVGTLSTFGAGHAGAEGFSAAWPIDAAAARALQASGDNVAVTFVPRGVFNGAQEQAVQLQGNVSFSKMRVIEE
jgi:hypothetical protein